MNQKRWILVFDSENNLHKNKSYYLTFNQKN